MRTIGLYGYGGVGKDEVGRILVENHGFTRYAKGDLIKNAMYKINPILSGEVGTIKEPERFKDMMRWYDGTTLERIDAVKGACPDARSFMQHLADDVVDVLGRDVWNDALWMQIRKDNVDDVVLTRLSLPFEVDRLRDNGGTLVRVVRNGYGPANSHPNEVALDAYSPDLVIINNGTLEDLEVEVRLAVEAL